MPVWRSTTTRVQGSSNIRWRSTTQRTIYENSKGSGGYYTELDVERISAAAVEFATKKITADIAYDYNLTTNPWYGFNITSLTTQEKTLLSYLYFDPVNPVPTTDYENIVGKAIQNSELVTLTLMNQLTVDPSQNPCFGLGISVSTLDMIHEQLVTPHLEISQLLGGSESVISGIIAEIDTAMANGTGCHEALRSFKDLMLVLQQGRITYIDYIAKSRQNNEIMRMLKEFAYKISCLNDIINKMINGPNSQSGNVRFKVNRPKPAIYAMAIFDLMDTWYKFLFPGQPIETEKYAALKGYVESLGTELEGRAELYRLLDIVYTDPADILADNQVAPGENPMSHYLTGGSSSTSTSTSNTCSTSNTGSSCCNTTTTDASGSDTTTTDSSGVTYVSSGPLAGSLTFNGGVLLESNNLVKIMIDDIGNITEQSLINTSETSVTTSSITCNICHCCPCICGTSQTETQTETQTTNTFDFAVPIFVDASAVTVETTQCCHCCCCPCICGTSQTETETETENTDGFAIPTIVDSSGNDDTTLEVCYICCCCPCICDNTETQPQTDSSGNEITDISGVLMSENINININ
jgi:hypothetical protein